MRWFPGFVLNVAYRVVAALRFRIWGHADACGQVTPEQRLRFLTWPARVYAVALPQRR